MRISDWSSDVCSSDLLSLRVFEVVDVEVAKVALGTAKALSHDAVGLGYTFRADDLGVCFHLGAVAFRHCGADSNLAVPFGLGELGLRSEEHTSELQSLMSISYAVFCWKKKTHIQY